MPSVIGTDAGSGINVAANYLVAKPSTQFGTRQLSVLTITKEGLTAGEGAADSLYSKIIRALQQTAEVWAVFAPVENSTDPDSFNVIISADSQWTGDTAAQGTTGGNPSGMVYGYGVLEAALNAGSGTTGIVVTATPGFSAPYLG